jgi:hypothetical protein
MTHQTYMSADEALKPVATDEGRLIQADLEVMRKKSEPHGLRQREYEQACQRELQDLVANGWLR